MSSAFSLLIFKYWPRETSTLNVQKWLLFFPERECFPSPSHVLLDPFNLMPFQHPLFTFDMPPNKARPLIKTYCSLHIKDSKWKNWEENTNYFNIIYVWKSSEGQGLGHFLHSASMSCIMSCCSISMFVACQKVSGDGFWIVFEKQCRRASLDLGLFWCGLLGMLFMVWTYTFWSLTSFK